MTGNACSSTLRVAVIERHRQPMPPAGLEHRAVERHSDVAAVDKGRDVAPKLGPAHGLRGGDDVGHGVIAEHEPVANSGRSGGSDEHPNSEG